MSVHESPGRALPPSCIKISRAPLQCPDPFRHPAQQTKLWSVPHACCPRAMHPCIQPPRASRPRAAPCDPSTLVPTCSAARCSRPVCARRRVYRVTSWGARDGLGRFRDVRLTRSSCAAQPRTSRAFLRAGADFGGVSSSFAVLLAGCRSGGRVTRVALSPLCSRLKPL